MAGAPLPQRIYIHMLCFLMFFYISYHSSLEGRGRRSKFQVLGVYCTNQLAWGSKRSQKFFKSKLNRPNFPKWYFLYCGLIWNSVSEGWRKVYTTSGLIWAHKLWRLERLRILYGRILFIPPNPRLHILSIILGWFKISIRSNSRLAAYPQLGSQHV